MEKAAIVGALGEERLLLPELINQGLLANDRVKFLMSLLQTACWHADHPDAATPSLEADKQACGLADPWLDAVVGGTRSGFEGYIVPGASRLVRRMFDETAAMLRPLTAAETDAGAQALAGRLETLRDLTAVHGNRVDAALIAQLTAVDPGAGDSLHRLVMDLHHGLNRLQGEIAHTTIDGAIAYGLRPEDTAPVEAFMRGLNRTAPLKFDHPGLGTTVTRCGEKLVIQNDIGTTDAHVLVIHVEGLTTRVTYTDIHLDRLNFFRSLFDGQGVTWEKLESRQNEAAVEAELFHLSVGEHTDADADGLTAFLTHLGSRLVFLIDWNRARKRLQSLIPKRHAVDLLKWAAGNGLGHRAFLIAGGDRLIFDTLTFAAKAPLPYGAKLDELLGEAEALDFLKFYLRTAAEGLLANTAVDLIRDQVTAELVERFSSTEELVMRLAARHADLIRQAADTVGGLLLPQADAVPAVSPDAVAQTAKEQESQADQLVIQARALVHRSGGPEVLRRLLEEADNAIDEVEEVAFLLTLPPARAGKPELWASQRDLAVALVAACEAWSQAVACAPKVRRGGERHDLHAFLETVERIIAIERRTDAAERAAKANLLTTAEDFRQLYVFDEVAGHLEAATDALMHAAQILREHILSDIITA